jgi:ABC-type uncharacterized transport system involved in gliding motility auxiliary subunit
MGLLVAGLVLVNALSARYFARWDWTEDRRYSLSDASKRLVRSLPDPVVLRLYLTPGLPQPYEAQSRYVRDLLGEYRAASGKVKIEVVDPDSAPGAKDAAIAAGVIPARFTQVASDQFQVREGFLGVVLFHQDKQKVLPFVKDADNLEYDLSSRIKQMITVKKPVLGFVTDHGEMSPGELMGEDTSPLHESFEIATVRLSTAETVSPAAVVLAGPSRTLEPAELSALEDLLVRGVPVALFLNRRQVDLGTFRSLAIETGLEPLLAHHGIDVDRDLVLDPQCQRVTIQSQQGQYSIANIVTYPAFLLSDRLSRKHLLTQSIDVLGFPYAHALHLSTSTPLTLTTLAESSPQSWVRRDLWNVSPFQLPDPAEEDPKGPFVLAVLAEGKTTTYTEPRREVPALKLFVAGSARMIDPQMPTPDGNRAFLAHLAEWMCQDEHLLAIPSKGSPFRPLRQTTPAARQLFKLWGYFFLPAAVLAWGFLRWRRRRSTKAAVRREFAPAPRAPEGTPLA